MPAPLAERLGFSNDARLVVVHADDVGMCHAANEGAFEALVAGPTTCGSVMVPCPWFFEAAARARELGTAVDLGVHLTLTAEWEHYRWGPVAGAPAVPSLVNAHGHFPRSFGECAENANTEDADRELRAQIDRALDAGIDVTHIDSHMGTVFAPQLLESYLQLSRDYRLPAFVVRPPPRQLEPGSQQGRLSSLIEEYEADGFPVFDAVDLDSLSFAPGEGEAHNAARIAGLKPGLTYLVSHPARAGEELSAIAPEAHCRDFERSFYGGEAGAKALADAGARPIGMRALRDLVRG
jgi:predicted glycoside hydrolase/deacetylase ChbG (UPF0249 family)